MHNSGESCRESDLTHLRLYTVVPGERAKRARLGTNNYRRPAFGTISLQRAQNRRPGVMGPGSLRLAGTTTEWLFDI